MSKLKVNKIENTATADGGVAIDVDGHVTIDGQQMPTAGPLSNRNILVNGGMRVAQRGSGDYPADRWKYEKSTAAVVTLSQETDAPTGFKNSIKAEITTAGGTGATNFTQFLYKIEANDISHLEYGTANAKTCTISFWVKHSLTGTYPFSLQNHDVSRIYPATYTINSANTWEFKTITFAGDTSGTWNTDGNGVGLRFVFAWNMGSNFTGGTEGAWAATASFANLFSTSGPDINGTVGNTVQWAGVQLEVGSKATPFEHRSYSDELLRCQRYFYKSRTGGTYPSAFLGFGMTSNRIHTGVRFPVPMRANPDVTIIRPSDNASNAMHQFCAVAGSNTAAGDVSFSSCTPTDVGVYGFPYVNVNSSVVSAGYLFHIEADSEL